MRRNEPERQLVWTEANLQALLVEEFFTRLGCRCEGFCPNLHYGANWEADVMMVHPSGYVTEYEIKLSRADFLADLKHKTQKHECMQAAMANRKIQPPFELPNYLVYVCPSSLMMAPESLPDYAGLMVVTGDGRLKTVKRAPVIHRHKFDTLQNLTKSLSWRLAKRMPVIYETTE